MGFSQGKSDELTNGFKRYTGIGKFTVLGVNPDMATLNKWGITTDKEPVYTGVNENKVTGKKTDFARISFYVKSVDIPDFITSFTVFVRREAIEYEGKYQVIDSNGNGGWANMDQIKTHATLFNKNGKKSKILTDYRTAYRGEVEVTGFIKALLCIDDAFKYVNEVWEPKDAETVAKLNCRSNDPTKWFDGDFSDLVDALTYQVGNRVQLLCGVGTDKKGRLFQDVFTGLVARKSDKNTEKRFVKEVNRQKANKTEWTYGPLTEHVIKSATPEEIEAAVAAAHEDDDDDTPFVPED